MLTYHTNKNVDEYLKPVIHFFLNNKIKEIELFLINLLKDICNKDYQDKLDYDYNLITDIIALHLFEYISNNTNFSISKVENIIIKKFSNYKNFKEICFNIINKTDNAVPDYDTRELLQQLEDYKFSYL